MYIHHNQNAVRNPRLFPLELCWRRLRAWPGASVRREEVVQAKTFTDVWSDVFVLQQTWDIWVPEDRKTSRKREKPSSTWKPHTSSTRLSRKGTSFSSSLSFRSMNQLSMGIPLESWKTNHTLWCRTNTTPTHRVRVLPDRRRLAVSCRWWWSWRDPGPGCSGLWCNSLGRRRSARGTAGAWRTHRGNHQGLKCDITGTGLL